MPGRWVDPPDGEIDSEDAMEKHETKEEEEYMEDEDASTSSDPFRMSTFHSFIVCCQM